MKGRLIIFLALLFSRVFITPICFSMHASEIQNPADIFEQVRLKKRRSTFIEEEYFHEASFGTVTSVTSVKRIPLTTSLREFFRQVTERLTLSLQQAFTPAATALFLRNRVLRI